MVAAPIHGCGTPTEGEPVGAARWSRAGAFSRFQRVMSLDFDGDLYLAELNERIRAEGKSPEREV